MFLKPNQCVIPTQAHDYPEWHLGREKYALWYIEIHQTELIEYLTQLRGEFSPFLFEPNTRQFHISLFICGFLMERQHFAQNDNFSRVQFEQQMQLLMNENIESFQISTGQIKSFESALFVDVLDQNNSLSKIRTLLSKQHQEIATIDYQPHITLGLYKKAFYSQQIFHKIKSVPQKTFNISVQHLTFGYYQAKIQQGTLYSEQQFYLSNLTTK